MYRRPRRSFSSFKEVVLAMWSPYLRLRPTMMLAMLPYHVNQRRAKPRKTMAMLDVIKKEEKANKKENRGSKNLIHTNFGRARNTEKISPQILYKHDFLFLTEPIFLTNSYRSAHRLSSRTLILIRIEAAFARSCDIYFFHDFPGSLDQMLFLFSS